MQQTLHAILRPPPTKVFTFDGLLCTFASVPLVPELLRTFASVPLVPEPPHEVSAVITPRHAHVAEQLEREGGREGRKDLDIVIYS